MYNIDLFFYNFTRVQKYVNYINGVQVVQVVLFYFSLVVGFHIILRTNFEQMRKKKLIFVS